MFLAKSQRVAIADIKVPERQRSSIDPEDLARLADSMQRLGLIHPIVLDSEMNLVVGGHRLAAAKKLGWDKIDARFNNTEDKNELQVIELEENLKRSDLSWQDQVRAINKLHTTYQTMDPEWTMAKTSSVLGLTQAHVSQCIGIAEELDRGNKAVVGAVQLSQAKTAMTRQKRREQEDITNTLFADTKNKPTTKLEVSADKPVVCANFLEWSQDVLAEKFNVIHCDFPYGVSMDKSGQVSQALGLYEDSADTYFQLLDCFVKNYFNFAQPVSHIMFWFSMNYYEETKIRLSQIKDARVFPYPLVWHKSDGRGIVPDAMREGRRTYETALLVSVGDRTIIKPVANSYAHPLDESRDHQARKPPKMLEHFLTMLVEPGVRLLDPTCGSGAALIAGRSLGADVFGVELNQDFVDRIKL